MAQKDKDLFIECLETNKNCLLNEWEAMVKHVECMSPEGFPEGTKPGDAMCLILAFLQREEKKRNTNSRSYTLSFHRKVQKQIRLWKNKISFWRI